MAEETRLKSAYELARAKPGCAMSVPVKAPYHYMESDYFDDLEWAATELFIATREERYLREAIEYAERAGESPWMGAVAAGVPAGRRQIRRLPQASTAIQAFAPCTAASSVGIRPVFAGVCMRGRNTDQRKPSWRAGSTTTR